MDQWQKCPVCEGVGTTGSYGFRCNVCSGKGRINIWTGLPPQGCKVVVKATNTADGGTEFYAFGIDPYSPHQLEDRFGDNFGMIIPEGCVTAPKNEDPVMEGYTPVRKGCFGGPCACTGRCRIIEYYVHDKSGARITVEEYVKIKHDKVTGGVRRPSKPR